MLGRTGWLLLVWACNGPDPVTPPPGGDDDDDDDDVPIETDTGTAPISPNRPEFDCFADIAYDDGRDGEVDGYRFEGFDAANPLWRLYSDSDMNGNGLLEFLIVYERDADGNVVREQRERSGAETVTSTWDERGNLLREETDTGSDGVTDVVLAYTYDANDQVLHYEADLGGDGNLEYEVDYTRTPAGIRLTAEEDADGDGDIDTTYTYTHDEFDRLSTLTIDAGTDLVIDALIVYTYTDPELRVGSYTLDEGLAGVFDGVFEEVGSFVYDAEGRVLYNAFDTSPADGLWDEEQITTRDAEGRVLTYTLFTPGSADPYELAYTYTYDALGRTVQTTVIATYDTGEVVIDEQTDTTFGGSCP